MPFGDRARAGVLGEPPERELAHRRLIALADEVEDAGALRDVVVRLVGPALAGVQLTAQAQELAPRAGCDPRVDAAFRGGDPRCALGGASGEQQRLGGDQFGVEALGRRRAVGGDDGVGERQRLLGRGPGGRSAGRG